MNLRMNPSDISWYQQELAQLVQRHSPTDGIHDTALDSLHFLRSSHVLEPIHAVSNPSICVVVQGAKTATVGEEQYAYDAATYLVTCVQLPVIGRIVQASPEAPYLSIRLSFSTEDIVDIVQETHSSGDGETGRGISVNPTTPNLLESLLRLVRLLDKPEDIPFLAPLMVREILYRVIQGDQGAYIKQFAVSGSHANCIVQAIGLIKQNYAIPISIEELAREVNLSTSAFHKHFKRVTNLSPLQYQKMIRLHEARHFLLADSLSAAEAGYRVGYESPTQFSREYSRVFGRPPKSDVKHMQSGARRAVP